MIAILDTGDPTRVSGGQSAFIRNILPSLDHDVALVGATPATRFLGGWRHVTVGGRPYPFLSIAHLSPPGVRPLLPLRSRCCAGVFAHYHQIDGLADLVYVHSTEMALPFAVFKSGKPLVLHLHGAGHPLEHSRYDWAQRQWFMGPYSRLMRTVFTAAKAVISVDIQGLALSESLGGPRECVRIPSCYDNKVFLPGDKAAARNRLGLPEDALVVAFVARLEKGKGTPLLVPLLKALRERGRDCRLLVAGDGSQRSVIEHEALGAGFSDMVACLGWLDERRLAEILRASDVFLLPSSQEGISIAALEAMGSGVPAVVSRVGGLAEVVKDGANGFLVDGHDVAALVGPIERMADDPIPPSKIVESVRDYAGEAVARRISSLLDEVMLSSRGR